MVVATHDLDLALKLTTRTVILNQGKIAAEGPTDLILHDETLLFNNGLY